MAELRYLEEAMLRRDFLQTLAGGALTASAARAATAIPLGLDAYSIRAFDWNEMQLLDYAARHKLDSVQISTNDFQSFESAHLRRVKQRAAELGVTIDVAHGQFCPTTRKFASGESPEEYLLEGVRVAVGLAAKVVRCYVGNVNSRGGDPPWEAHVASSLKVLKNVRSQTVDAGVKFAIENHGDFEARELKEFIEEAGPEFVACCLDSGNPMSVLEDPMLTLEVLAPYAVTSHIRDSVVYEHPRGAAFQWVALGDGSIDYKKFTKRYAELCPKVPMQMEVITGRAPTVLPFLEEPYWKKFPRKPAADFARFVKLAKQGHPFMGNMMIGGGRDQPEAYLAALREQQRVDVERSFKYAREQLGVGAG
jgi:3-oxoisoapionate decarboxylase